MTKQVKRLADSVATRRGFLGKLGWGAMAAAAALGGLLASPTVAQAKKDGGKEKTKVYCCEYSDGMHYTQICSPGDHSTCLSSCFSESNSTRQSASVNTEMGPSPCRSTGRSRSIARSFPSITGLKNLNS